MASKLLMESTPPYAALALAITSQDWTALGLDDDPMVAPSSDVELTVERITSLLLIRLVALHAPKGKYQDLSTTTICRTSLMAGKPWPEPITDEVVTALRGYVRRIVKQYFDAPYHNAEHCYHVVVSVNKLIDLCLNSEALASQPTKPPMYGLREDPLLHLLLVFCALIHDVEHRGIPNRQLAMEDDELAILYNDQSIAENRSLTIAFRELLKNDYATLKKVMFANDDEYRRFRKYSTQIVLQTDIASPERTQIRKSKWKEAFGEEFETVERKVKHALRRASQVTPDGQSRRVSAAEILSEMEEIPDHDTLTGTPEHSETEDIDIGKLDKSLVEQSLQDQDDPLAKPIPGVARTSIASKSERNSVGRSISMPSQERPSDFTFPGDEALGYATSENYKKFQRRISAHAGRQRRYHRLGISRSIDLSGEFIESYHRGSGNSAQTAMANLQPDEEEHGGSEEEPDELKISVILEQLLTAADVGHNLQGFGQMEKFSKRLYLELKKAHKEGRGPDPSPGWYGNQIAFLESYLLPLAQRIEDMGIFGPLIGPVFARLVESNRDQWLENGQKVTEETLALGAEIYPV